MTDQEMLQQFLAGRQEELKKAEEDFAAQKVDPYAKFGAGLGQVLQGRNVDTEWADKRNKLAYDETLGRLKLEQSEAEKRAEQKRQFDVEQDYKNRALKENIEARKETARILAGQREDAIKFGIEQKKEQATRLSDKQLESINDFDDSINKMQATVDELGSNSNWVGFIDSKVPDALVGDDQVAFRSSVGRMVDSYRKLITGAGASNQELARLESRLPKTTDTYKNFVAKAKDFVREVQTAKNTHLTNLERAGKNVSAFKDVSSEQPQTKVVNGKTYVKVPGGWTTKDE